VTVLHLWLVLAPTAYAQETASCSGGYSAGQQELMSRSHFYRWSSSLYNGHDAAGLRRDSSARRARPEDMRRRLLPWSEYPYVDWGRQSMGGAFVLEKEKIRSVLERNMVSRSIVAICARSTDGSKTACM
jgi:hypothetical protein